MAYLLRRPIAEIEAMPVDEQLGWGLVMDYISGPLDWRRGNIFDARAASLQCVSTDGMTVEDFMMFREPQPTLSNIEEFQKRGEQMESLRAFMKTTDTREENARD